MGVSAGFKVEGLQQFARNVRAAGRGDLLAELRDELAKAERTAVARMKTRAVSAPNSRQAVRAASSLRGSRTKDAAVVRGGSSAVPFAGGAAWGAKHDVSRRVSRGTRAGWNQFPLPQGEKSWFWLGARDASQELEKDVVKGIEKIFAKF